MIDKLLTESAIKRNTNGSHYPFYYYLDDDLEHGTTTLSFKASDLKANGDYGVSIEFSIEELLVLMKSHLADKSCLEIASLISNLSDDTAVS